MMIEDIKNYESKREKLDKLLISSSVTGVIIGFMILFVQYMNYLTISISGDEIKIAQRYCVELNPESYLQRIDVESQRGLVVSCEYYEGSNFYDLDKSLEDIKEWYLAKGY